VRSQCVCLFSCILYRHKRSKIKGDLDTKYKNTDTKQRNPQSTRHKRSKIKGDKDTKYKNINKNIGTHSQCVCLYSCILYLYHLLFQISCVLWTVGSFVCVYILVFCIGDKDTKYKNINTSIGTHSPQDTRDLK
jgi:hypothetical protein